MQNTDTFHILALDGGGARGIYTAHLLAQIEHAFQVRIRDCFDLIAGTSTGSIVAGAAVSDIPMAEIVELFEIEAPDIFQKRWYRNPLFFSKYSNEKLARIIAKHIPATLLSDIATPLMITSSEMTTSESHIFRSGYYIEKLGDPPASDRAVNLHDAILASCAAPTFFATKPVGTTLLADGGLWANNPSIAAFTEARAKFGKTVTQLRILSIGTGHSTNMYRNSRSWGFLTGWGGVKLISYVMTLQSQTAANITKLLLKENYLRINPTIDFWELDSIRQLENLKSLASRDFTEYMEKLKRFMRY